MTVRGIRAHRAILLTFLLLAISGCAEEGQYPQTTFEPVSEFGRFINALFYNTFWWTIGIMLLVEILILVFIFLYRERPGAPQPKQIHGHTGLEIAWTIIPAVIVLFIAVPTVGGIFKTQAKASEGALQVEVIGHQWWWEFRYPELGVVTANELVLPANREVELKMWSADVIHSFWIPRVGGKRDVNPQPRARPDERDKFNYLVFNVEKPGYYLGQCAEFCGTSHAIMRTSVLALEENEFNQWAQSMGGTTAVPADTVPVAAPDSAAPADAQSPTGTATRAPTYTGMAPTGAPAPGRAAPQSMAQVPEGTMQARALMPGRQPLEDVGQRLFTTRACVACHTVQGTTAQGKLGPNLTRFGARRYLAAGARPNTVENLEAWIRHPQSIKPGALMPGAREGGGGMPATGLSEDEIKAIAAYLHSLK